MTGNAVEVAVRGHDAGDADLANGRLERQQLLVAQLARPDVRGCLVEPALGQAVPDEVLGGRGNAMFEVRALEPADVRAAEHRGEVRVLAVRLLDAAPARVPGDVEDRGKGHARPDRLHPPPDRCGHCFDEDRIERGRRADRLLERGRVASEQPVERLLVEEGRDAEPRLLDEEALDRIARLRRGDRAEVRRAGHPTDVADAVCEAVADERRIELRLAPEQLERPERAELGELLVERHPCEQVGDAGIDRLARVTVPCVDRGHQPFTEPLVSPLTM